jgi:Fic family protein
MSTRFYEVDARVDALRERLSRISDADAITEQFAGKLELSWIYHDLALEGVVVTEQELHAALDQRAVADASMVNLFQEIRRHKTAIDFVKEIAQKRTFSWNLDIVKKIYCHLSPEENPKTLKYRKDNPLHRLYFHDICAPEKIPYRMRKLQEWLKATSTQNMHPIRRAAELHFRLMAIFPFSSHSGRVSRLVMNLMLMRDGYLPAIIHAIDRQRYYDTLRAPTAGLANLACEAIEAAIDAQFRFATDVVAARQAARKKRRAG